MPYQNLTPYTNKQKQFIKDKLLPWLHSTEAHKFLAELEQSCYEFGVVYEFNPNDLTLGIMRREAPIMQIEYLAIEFRLPHYPEFIVVHTTEAAIDKVIQIQALGTP